MNLDEHSQASVVGDLILIDEYCGSSLYSLYLNERWKVTEATGTIICRLQTDKIFLDMSILSDELYRLYIENNHLNSLNPFKTQRNVLIVRVVHYCL
jgi:hypothetical protein